MLPNKNEDLNTQQNYTFIEGSGVNDTHQWKPEQYKMSVWLRLAYSILTRTSDDLGGSTCISSTFTASPAPQQTAAVEHHNLSNYGSTQKP